MNAGRRSHAGTAAWLHAGSMLRASISGTAVRMPFPCGSATALLTVLLLASCNAPSEGDVQSSAVRPSSRLTPVVTRDGTTFLLGGDPIQPFGLRAINALQSDPIADRLLASLSWLRAHGVQSVVVGLQGGRHAEGDNSAFTAFRAEGSLEVEYLERLGRVLDSTAQTGMVVVVNLFYRGRDQELTDAAAVRRAVRESMTYLRPWRHVWIYMINEPGHAGFDHQILMSSQGQTELFRVAKATDPDRIVYVSPARGANEGFLVDSWSRLREVTPPEAGNVAIEYVRGDAYLEPGVFPNEFRDDARRHAAQAARAKGYWFWHASWHQKADADGWPRFDAGGAGTANDPGTAFIWDVMRELSSAR